jgi:hypothetical protein
MPPSKVSVEKPATNLLIRARRMLCPTDRQCWESHIFGSAKHCSPINLLSILLRSLPCAVHNALAKGVAYGVGHV